MTCMIHYTLASIAHIHIDERFRLLSKHIGHDFGGKHDIYLCDRFFPTPRTIISEVECYFPSDRFIARLNWPRYLINDQLRIVDLQKDL